jgi:hypothetical protein
MGDMNRCLMRRDQGDRFVTRHIAGETVIVPVSGSADGVDAIYTLNEVGSFVWRLIDGRRSARAIAEAVSAEYDVDPGRAARDVDDLLATLEASGLVEAADCVYAGS